MPEPRKRPIRKLKPAHPDLIPGLARIGLPYDTPSADAIQHPIYHELLHELLKKKVKA